MKRAARILAVVLVCSAVAAGSDSAKHLYKKAVDAEARQDYETAFAYYKQAYDLKPTELKYRVPFERTRFLAAASKVRRAQKLRDQGKLQDALMLFEEAAAIDPSNELAAQEIRHTQQMIEKQSGTGAPAAPPKATEEDLLRKRLQEARAPVMLNELSGNTISALECSEDAKICYETIGKLAGINVLFDPDYTSRRLSVKLRNVTLQEGLDIVALESRTFWRPVTPNTIFVAQDTQTKRRELEQNVIKTFYLGNVSTPTDLQDIVNAIRTVLEVQRIQQIPSQNAIVIKGTPDQLALAQKMVDDIDKSKPEVIVDVVVAQVRKDKLRDMGIIPPQNAAVALQGTNVTTTPPSTTGGTTTTTTTPSQGLNFNLLQHLNSTNYAVTIDPITAKLLFSDSSSKIIQSPRIRATNGEKATLKIADKIPIATGSFGTPLGVGTAVGAVGVNTQFTYTDVGVIMELTPTVHPDGQITLKTSLEISNLNGSQTIGGITQPIISQRKVDHTIRLSDGEVNMLGGILENTETVSTTGTPFLGSIPILRYLFSQESKEKITNEIVFLLIPHIVRRQDLDDMNRRAFDVGTGTSIELHPASKPPTRLENGNPPAQSPGAGAPSAPAMQTNPPALAAPRVLPQPSAPAPQQVPSPQQPVPQQNVPATPPPAAASQSTPASGSATNPQGSGPLSLRFDPGSVSPAQGSTFALNVILANGQDISTVSAEIVYDPKVVQFVTATQGDFLGKDGQSVTPPILRDDPASGRVRVSLQRPPNTAGVSGDGTVFNLMFMAKAKGTGAFSIGASGARNSQNQPLAVQGSQAAVTVN
jgi:general secretion pathway protein D